MASMNSDVATGRRIKGRDGFIRRDSFCYLDVAGAAGTAGAVPERLDAPPGLAGAPGAPAPLRCPPRFPAPLLPLPAPLLPGATSFPMGSTLDRKSVM